MIHTNNLNFLVSKLIITIYKIWDLIIVWLKKCKKIKIKTIIKTTINQILIIKINIFPKIKIKIMKLIKILTILYNFQINKINFTYKIKNKCNNNHKYKKYM